MVDYEICHMARHLGKLLHIELKTKPYTWLKTSHYLFDFQVPVCPIPNGLFGRNKETSILYYGAAVFNIPWEVLLIDNSREVARVHRHGQTDIPASDSFLILNLADHYQVDAAEFAHLFGSTQACLDSLAKQLRLQVTRESFQNLGKFLECLFCQG